MGDFTFNADFGQIAPNLGASRNYFPVSDSKGWLCYIRNAEPKETNAKDGQFLDLELVGDEGPVMGATHDWGVTLANKNQQAVEIGRGTFSAIAHVTGHMRVGKASEWFGKRFRVVVVPEKPERLEQYPGSTRIVAVLDIHGNKPGQAGQGALQGQNNGGGSFGGGGNAQGQNFQQGNTQQGQFGGQGGNGGGNFGGGNQGQGPQGSDAGNGGFANGQGQQGNGGGFNPNNTGGGDGQFNGNNGNNGGGNFQQGNNGQNGNFQGQNGNQGGNFQQGNGNGGGAGPGWGQQ